MSQKFIGVKLINAIPMNRQAYNDFRGWTVPKDENPYDDGYLVEYLDGGKPNTDQYAGYVSWSPKEQFEKAYRQTNGLTFGLAIEALKLGIKVSREGWNGKGMYLAMIAGNTVRQAIADHYGHAGETFPVLDAIYMKTADDKLVPWLASQTDILADDWMVTPAK